MKLLKDCERMFDKPHIIKGNNHTDHRGTISFINDFKFDGVERFYIIHHPETSIIRAWQGHKYESKYYFPIKGSWIIAWVKMDFDKPVENWRAEYIKLSANDNKMIFLPPGYANGFKALDKDAIIIGFSVPGKFSEEETLRWNPNKWLEWDKL